MSGNRSRRVLVLGIGNVLWADEGFGVRCAEALNEAWDFSPEVTVMDGGTQGLYLLPHVQDADCLLVFDAIDWGDPAGTVREVVGDEVPRFMGVKKMSLHQTGFQEVLAAASLSGQQPQQIVLIGVQPVELDDYGGSLRDCVKARVPDALALALKWLRQWGISAKPRQENSPRLNDEALALTRYEAQRPDAASACRFGDSRFLGREPS